MTLWCSNWIASLVVPLTADATSVLFIFFLSQRWCCQIHIDVLAPGAKEQQMLLLPLGQRLLSTAFCVHPPPHQSSTRQEGAQRDWKGKHSCKIARKGKSTWPPMGEEKGPCHQGDTYVCSWRCHHKVLQPLQRHRLNGRQSRPGVKARALNENKLDLSMWG